MSNFILMNKDIKILSFKINRDKIGGVDIQTTESFSNHLPLGSQDLSLWLSERQAPKHKEHIVRLLKLIGCEDIEGFVRVTHALSLNDTYWVKPLESNLSWDSVSLYRNEFDENVARIAFEGGLHGENFSTTSLSPEYGAQGAFDKCWKRTDDNKIMLYKTGTEGFANAGLEPYSEFYAAQIADIICKKSVKYELGMYRGKLVSKCELFTDEKIGFVTASKLFAKNVSDIKIKEFCDKKSFGEDFARMVVLDALTINTDRHRANYGFLVDNDTQELLGFAPVFDNNQSLLPYASEEDLTSNLLTYLESRPTRIGGDFNEAANAFLSKDIIKDLNNLKGFKFERHNKYNLPEKRIVALEKMVNGQIDRIVKGIRLYNPINKTVNIERDSILPEKYDNSFIDINNEPEL